MECHWQQERRRKSIVRGVAVVRSTGFAASERVGRVESPVVGRHGGRLNAWMSD